MRVPASMAAVGLAVLLSAFACGSEREAANHEVCSRSAEELIHLLEALCDGCDARPAKDALARASPSTLAEVVACMSSVEAWNTHSECLVARDLRRRAARDPSADLSPSLDALLGCRAREAQVDLVAALVLNRPFSVDGMRRALLGPPGPQRLLALEAASQMHDSGAALIIPTLTLYDRDPSPEERSEIEAVVSELLGLEGSIAEFFEGAEGLSQRSLSTAVYWLSHADPEGRSSGFSGLRSLLKSGDRGVQVRLLRALDMPSLWNTPWQALAAECATWEQDPEVTALAREVGER